MAKKTAAAAPPPPPRKRKNPPPGAGGQWTQKAGGRKPIRTSISARALAALIQPECKSIAQMATEMDNDYQVTLAKTTLIANIAAVDLKVEASGDDERA